MRRQLLLAASLTAAGLIAVITLGVLAPRPAEAADLPFNVTETVQGAGASSTEAYTQAVNGGRRRAWESLFKKLTPQDAWPKLAAIDDATLQRMVKRYQASNERRSTTRYAAEMTYVFNDALVRHFFRANNVAYAASAGLPVMVIPMAPGYAPDSPWGRAWQQVHNGAGIVPIILPSSGPLNRAALGPVGFDTAAWSDVAPAASRDHAVAVAVVQAGPGQPGHLSVGIRVLYSNQLPQALNPLDIPLPARTPLDRAYGLAAQAAANAIGEAWKARNAIDFSKRSALTVNASIDSLSAWGALQQRVLKLPVVMNVRIEAILIGQVRAQIAYAGTQAQLEEFLTQAGLSVENRDGDLWLAAAPPAPDLRTQ